ncbi:hypothetical protein KVV02_000550 [Mortierella alpina]|uniref:CDT1 Geminin-binding domain-containing protein n=1 Tax=Mortierella alpina TaxID=64518 RepID=A0A9P8A2S8_MORAP|nr:hypothetical protein KVV02_000550 [Mortierella alpina]
MAAGNQTRLGFAQQKRGTGRALIAKRATNAADGDDTPEDALTKADRLLERVGVLSQTMEEKLAAYRKAKEGEKTQKKDSVQPVAARSLRAEAKRTREQKPDNIAQKTLQEFTKATQKVKESKREAPIKQLADARETSTEHSTDSDDDDAKEHTATATASTSPSPKASSAVVVEEDEVVEETQFSKTLDKAVDTTGHTKTVAEQTSIKAQITQEAVKQDAPEDDEDDEDNIHPLARTVVKSTVLESLAKSNLESPRVSQQTADSLKAVGTPSKIPPRLATYDSITETPSLPLPSHLRTLYDIFKGLETVLVFTKRQGQLCFYHKLKKHVELQSSRNFEIKHLAQFKTILPEGYKYTASPCLFEGARIRSILIDMLDIKDEVEGVFVPEVEKRQRLFLDRLYDRVKKHHQAFLSSTTPPRTDTYPHGWHPEFDLESVAAIEESEVPMLKPSIIDASRLDLRKLGSRRDFDQRTTPATTTAISKEETSAASTSSDPKEKQLITAVQLAEVAPDSPGVKVLSALEQLRERIRQKQLDRKASGQGLATPEEKRQALIASRLPGVFDLIRFKRVDVISASLLTGQVVKSSKMPISQAEGQESLEMMAKVLPEWCSVFETADGEKYFKVLQTDAQGTTLQHDMKALRARLVARSMGK